MMVMIMIVSTRNGSFAPLTFGAVIVRYYDSSEIARKCSTSVFFFGVHYRRYATTCQSLPRFATIFYYQNLLLETTIAMSLIETRIIP